VGRDTNATKGAGGGVRNPGENGKGEKYCLYGPKEFFPRVNGVNFWDGEEERTLVGQRENPISERLGSFLKGGKGGEKKEFDGCESRTSSSGNLGKIKSYSNRGVSLLQGGNVRKKSFISSKKTEEKMVISRNRRAFISTSWGAKDILKTTREQNDPIIMGWETNRGYLTLGRKKDSKLKSGEPIYFHPPGKKSQGGNSKWEKKLANYNVEKGPPSLSKPEGGKDFIFKR